MTNQAILCEVALAKLLPMHLFLTDQGRILSIGPTLSKLLPMLSNGLHGVLANARAGQKPEPLEAIRKAVDKQTRLFLRVQQSADLVLRGHGVRVAPDRMLVNLGFGIGLHHAVRIADLDDADFAPSELAMELLFLQEANRGVLTELSRFNQQLASAREVALLEAQTDPLTALGNRRALETVLARALRSDLKQRPFALMHMDLDHFKQVNDRLGHKAGDDLLQAVGQVLRNHIRREDVAARIGGDEFVMVLRGMTCQTALAHLADRIICVIQDLSPPELGDLGVSASMGIIIWTHVKEETPMGLLELADAALYQSKRTGRGRATFWT
ncbi:GGDEF domain-containing protein [Paracoccus sp. JM45]|uniref:GGDEF domain-containing protein n=1 Tax=Paracoccus sp. JM45 TaxID=2283626 RepID=UPI000E6B554D|nr:GGDEF domain-containing protein [Paracoccus sp. JM45]RJE80123.1 GGDEF domain-containing protein [Paracoccus sp. JM45]